MSSYIVHYTPAPTGLDPEVPLPSIYNRTLQKAADHVGGQRALARYLKVPLGDLYAWMRPGAEPPPQAEDRRRAEVMQALQDLLPDSKP